MSEELAFVLLDPMKISRKLSPGPRSPGIRLQSAGTVVSASSSAGAPVEPLPGLDQAPSPSSLVARTCTS